eukprot:TRINITY_DN3816_c0_g1_i5.p1 TRINITY_DN3816_c0_g1~~TRINITY_DN3816_c0_g1_i5.p1  ORF type:complete len:175 (+),score=20.71 TRINITY_DN3816_c0_g1_i5:154-678(+)
MCIRDRSTQSTGLVILCHCAALSNKLSMDSLFSKIARAQAPIAIVTALGCIVVFGVGASQSTDHTHDDTSCITVNSHSPDYFRPYVFSDYGVDTQWCACNGSGLLVVQAMMVLSSQWLGYRQHRVPLHHAIGGRRSMCYPCTVALQCAQGGLGGIAAQAPLPRLRNPGIWCLRR